MASPKKEETVQELREVLSKSTIAILTGYRGLSVADLTQLRRKLRDAGVDFHVVKNTLATLAARGTDKERLAEVLQGPTAIAFGYGDVSQPAKVLQDYVRATRLNMPISGAAMKGRALSSEQVSMLATLPPREVLLGMLLAGMQSPIIGLVTVLNGNLRGLMNVLQARAKQLEGA